MNFNPLVSIALLCYNHEKYIAKAIESVINQTYRNIELIIVDNGSTDNSKNIIKSKIKNDNRVFFIDLSENTFVSYGWNYGAKQCKGEYIVSLSGDDYFEINKIEIQLSFMLENKLSNSFTWVNCVNNDEEILDNHNLEGIFNRRLDPSILKRILITEGNTLCATSFMFHKSIFEKYGYYDTRLLQSQDYDLWLKILINEDIFILPEKLTNYRVRDDDGNLSINMDESSRKRSIFESVLFLKQITSFDIKTISLSIEENCNEENKYIKLFSYFIKKEKKLYATAILLSMYEDLNKNSEFNLEKYKYFFNMYSGFDLLNIIENEKLREIVHKKDLQIEELNELVKSYRDILSEQLLSDKNIQKLDIEKFEEKIFFLENELVSIYSSKSWQITKPFRIIFNKIRNFKKGLILMFKSEYNVIKKSGLFDEDYYHRMYEDVKGTNLEAIKHYIEFGWKEGRNPSEKFDTKYYLDTYKDVRDANVNPLLHYIKHGKKEARKISHSHKIVTSMEKIKNFIYPVYNYFPFLKKLNKKIKDKKNKLNFKKLITSSSQNDLAITELTKRRFDFTEKYFTNNLEKKENEFVSIDISIVSYNSSKWVEQFINSLIKQSYPLKLINLYFVDNGSKDNTVELLNVLKKNYLELFEEIEIFSQKNVGFGAGHDKAITYGKSKYCMVSNIDLEFEKDAILNIIKIAEEDNKDEYASWEFRQIPYEHPKYYDPITLETNWSAHACILIKKDIYEKVGGYEPRIFMYAEDVELSYRFRAYGYHLKYCPSAIVYHYTYEEANEIKPLQFQGSLLGNAYLRLRYGNKIDKLSILPLYLSLLIKPEIFNGSKKMIQNNILKIFKNFNYFNKFSLSNKNFYASFRGFDYEMIRDGAFHEIKLPENTPLISIIVRTYKERDTLLKQALISIGNQTYKNIEIIVVEDGGSTMEPLVNSINHKLNIKYFGLEKIGRSATGNYGLSEASGEYCLFLDDDDLLFADHVEILLVALESNKQMAASYSLAFEIPTRFKDNKKDDYTEDEFRLLNVFYQEFDYDVLTHHNYFPIQTVMFKRNLFLERGGFDESLTYLEDWNLWLRYAHNNQFVYVPKTTSLYRVPADNTVAQERHELLEQAYIEAKEKAMKRIKEISNENK